MSGIGIGRFGRLWGHWSMQCYITVESCEYAPLFCMLASGKTGEGAYSRDRDISEWRPLPTDDRHVGARCTSYLMDKAGEKRQSKPWCDTSSYCSMFFFTGISIQIARFHSQSRGLMRETKIPMQELNFMIWLKMGGGLIREGGVLAGFYGIYIILGRF